MKSINNKNLKGFTMVELIVVIVILGILSATALPKFMDLSGAARKSAIASLGGTVKSTVNMVRMKAAAEGKDIVSTTGNAYTIDLDHVGTYEFTYGYPEVISEGQTDRVYFSQLLDLGGEISNVSGADPRTAKAGEFSIYESNETMRIGYGEGNLDPENCYVQYSSNNASLGVTVVDSGCDDL